LPTITPWLFEEGDCQAYSSSPFSKRVVHTTTAKGYVLFLIKNLSKIKISS
jgi:hypothetical protein